MHSLTYNGTAFSTYGLIVRLATPSPTLVRSYDSIQVQDRSWAGKGQAGPSIFTLSVVIVGTSAANCLSRVSTIRGLLDQEEECALSFDMYTDRYWMAKFDSLEGVFTAPTVWEGTLIFTCHDGKAYANAPISGAPQTFALNAAATADAIYSIALDPDGDFIYITTYGAQVVLKLSSIDLSLIATSVDYGGRLFCVCAPTGLYVYCGGETTKKVYQLKKSDLTKNAESPSYGGSYIRTICDGGLYIYYGGNGGAGENDICKLLKSDMTTIIRSVDYGGIIYDLCANNIHVLAGGAATNRVRRYAIADLAYVDQSDNYGTTIKSLTLDAVNVYLCGDADTVWKITLADMTAETASADLGGDLNCIAVDSTYIYTAGADEVVRKLLISDMSLIANSEPYGTDVLAIEIDTVKNFLFIGGHTIVGAVWKLDTRHMPQLAATADVGVLVSPTTGYVIVVEDEYVYIAGVPSKVVKLRASDLTIVAESANYGGLIYALAVDADGGFVYCGGATTNKVYKLNISDLTKVSEGPSYGGTIWSIIAPTGLYIFYGGNGGAGQYDVSKLLKSDMTTEVRSADYTGIIYGLAATATHVYAGGATLEKVRQHLITTMATVADGPAYGGTIRSVATDGTYLAYGGATVFTVKKLTIADMATIATSASLGGYVWSVAMDATYVYAGVEVPATIYKLLLADMTTVAKSASYGATGSIYKIALTGGCIFFVEYGTYYKTYKLDKRVLWRRSDHELTVTTVGTARTNPLITLTANGANYWAQTIENTTTSQEFQWEGTQPTTEVLEVDSDMWSVELQGVSALSGQSGDFVQLAPGANVLYFENVVGTVEVDYTDRFA